MEAHASQNTPEDHLVAFYKTFDEIVHERFDGMILTGAPVETMDFERVDYWHELSELFEYAKTNVYSSMFICWGAQAALHYYYDIPKHPLKSKVFGVFEHKVVRPLNPLMRGFDEIFYAPHSRHTTIKKEDVKKVPEVRILAESKEVGLHILATDNGRQIFILGHQEYDKETLYGEYKRDLDKGLPIEVPKHYFRDDDPEKEILFRWRSHASLLFTNWLNYYVYQETPYDLEEL
jgi:homoserine O-succinyltransferase